MGIAQLLCMLENTGKQNLLSKMALTKLMNNNETKFKKLLCPKRIVEKKLYPDKSIVDKSKNYLCLLFSVTYCESFYLS